MGGGDLNLKKSWHPHTLKNQEKVWKAEQAKQAEESKLNDLRREIEDERNREELKRIGVNSGVLARPDNDKKLEWMYKGSTELINRDEYLLGRKIDKSFETLQAEEKAASTQNMIGIKQQLNHVEHECIPFSIRSYKNLQSTEQVDMQRKVMEDPLMLIKQKEIESRRKLLENPVKLKELHRILKTDQMLRTKKSKKSKSKKSKKKHKKRKSKKNESETDDSDSAASEQDLDKKLEKQYKKLQRDNGDIVGLSLSKLLNAKYDTLSKELDKAARTRKKSHRSSESSKTDEHSDADGHKKSSNEVRHRGKDSKQSHVQNAKHRARTSRSRSVSENRRQRSRTPQRRKQTHSSSTAEYSRRRYTQSRSRSREPNKQYQRHTRKRESSPQADRRGRSRSNSMQRRSKNSRRSRSNSTSRHRPRRSVSKSLDSRREQISKRSPTPKSSKTANKSNKLSEDEKAAKLREMMENASWREVDRSKAVKKHREDYANEEERHKAREFDKDFINKEVKKAIDNHSSVGTRIRANLNNIQRTTAAMDSNFARK